MKICFTLVFVLVFFFCRAQGLISVREGSPKKDEAFSKVLNTILSASGKDFATIPKQFYGKDIVDSTWTVTLLLPGADEATINKGKGYIMLNEHFAGNGTGIIQLLDKIKASLPADFKYSLDYDAASGISDYAFSYDSKAVSHPGYPDEFHLNGDVHTAVISILLSK